MSSTPRKSSIRSRRAPASLRLRSSTSRQASNPRVSLVFAQPDQSSSTATSEEALSRQLDGDTGGKQMGLRSRQGSGTSVRTVKTCGRRSPTSSVKEEEEDDETRHVDSEDVPQAGPSKLPEQPITNSLSEMSKLPEPVPIRLNPKSSISWLRWNAPPTSFPRSSSPSQSKGKERERTPPPSDFPPAKIEAGAEARTKDGEGSVDPDIPLHSSVGVEDAQGKEVSAIVPAPPISVPPSRRRWWGRSNNPPVLVPPPIPPVPPPIPPDSAKDLNMKMERSYSDQMQAHIPSTATMATETAPTPKNESVDTQAVHSGAAQRADLLSMERYRSKVDGPGQPAAEASGWRAYLGKQPQVDVAASVNGVTPSRGDRVQELESCRQQSPGNPAPISSEDKRDTPATLSTATTLQQPWSGYLLSFISSPKPLPTVARASTPAPPTEAEETPADQKSAPISLPADPSLNGEAPSTAPHPGPSPAPPIHTPRKDSMASSSGWLNYLAFRTSQKPISDTSTDSIKSGKEPNNVDSAHEEVMDFSGDPEFPTATSEGIKKDEKAVGQASDHKKAPHNLAVRNRRVSTTSTRSAGSMTPLSSSPKPSSAKDGTMPAATPSSKAQSSSALPPPPAAPAAQSNLVIPSFSTTFDRPPRSLPPLPDASETAKGIAAATTGLAWRALGAVGNYVYNSEAKAADEREWRGKKEGRTVGGDLPRRIGLGGGDQDNGWRNVKRVAVIGIHGWFPAKMLNSVIGEPTGTSVKFANMMGQAVSRFFQERGVNDIRLTFMPLEGEGTIDRRVDSLYKAYLSNPAWINDLRRADAIFFAAHSQGCIVTTHLISRLIAQGHIRTPTNQEAVSRCEWAFGLIGVVPDMPRDRRSIAPVPGADGGHQKVAMLAMCGVHLGPLYSISTSSVIQPYLQWFENAAARELFEFQDTASTVSLAYQKALSAILENDVRVLLLASLNDQVVPIYGSSFSTATHPLLLRALFVDGASYSASDFMTNLLCFAFMLRNAGLDDQRLVEHLSEATAGSLTGVGHSSPYEEPECYSLAVSYLFQAGPARVPLPPLQVESFSAMETRNDFELPWIMRALVDSPEVKDLFGEELKDLKEGIVAWRPTTKALKEIKKRLEPMAGRQSKLRPLASSPSSSSLPDQATSGVGVPNRGMASNAGPSGLRKDW